MQTQTHSDTSRITDVLKDSDVVASTLSVPSPDRDAVRAAVQQPVQHLIEEGTITGWSVTGVQQGNLRLTYSNGDGSGPVTVSMSFRDVT